MSQIQTQCPPLGITARATIDRVIDGDTIVVEVRDTILQIRLLDCWAPESGTPHGEDATDAMRVLAKPGSKCRVHIPTGDANHFGQMMTFGRFLGHVWLEGDEDSLSHHMVQNGHATREKPE